MRLLSILFFAGGVVFLILTVTQVLTRGWGPLDVELLHVYLVVLPRYLLLVAAVFSSQGSFRLLYRIPETGILSVMGCFDSYQVGLDENHLVSPAVYQQPIRRTKPRIGH